MYLSVDPTYLADILDMAELRELIKSRHIVRRNHPTLPLAILNYTNECLFSNFWPETVQQCRGLIVETNNSGQEILPESEVISRPFHKFFGLNHSDQPSYSEGNLPSVVPTVTEKMDGWFGILWSMTDKKGVFHAGVASRGSFTSPGALFATDKLRKLIKYGAIHEFPKGYSAIFEIIFKAGKIVIDYPFEGLVLLGMVHIETGEELTYDELQSVWAKIAGYSQDNRPWIRLVKAHRMTLAECSLASTQYLKSEDLKNKEGFVLTYRRPGTWPIKVKVKLEDYKRLHKLITGVTPQQIWRTLHDPMSPLLGNEVPDTFRAWSTSWRDKLYQQFHEELDKATALLISMDFPQSYNSSHGNATPKELRGVFFNKIKASDHATIAMSLYDGKIYEAYQAIWKRIKPVGNQAEVFYKEGQGE